MASPGPSSASPMNPRTKSQKPPPMGITAGVEDSKYQAKYKELKRKVKDIESDNEKLHFKVLNAKRNIQRMKLERAILYERLGQVSPSPAPIDRHSAPAHHPGPPVHHSPVNHPPNMDPDPNFIEYSRPHSRVTPARSLPVIDTSVAHPGISSMHRRSSGSGGPDIRQLPPLPPNPPIPLDGPRSPHSHPHHDRSRNLPPQQDPYHLQGPQHYVDNLPPMQHVLHSPQMAERDREGSRSRRHDLHELAGTHDAHAHSIAPISPSNTDPRSGGPGGGGGGGRMHNHQRMGPGSYINRDDPRARELEWEQERDFRDREREREMNYSNARQRERDREPQPHSAGGSMHSPVHRPRAPPAEYPDQHHPSSSSRRDDYYHDPSGGGGGPSGSGAGYSRVSRSGTPGSGSGSNSAGVPDGPSRPDSRGPSGPSGPNAYYDDRGAGARGYRLRPLNAGHPATEEPGLDFVHEDGRSQSQSRDRGSAGAAGGFPPPPQHREAGPDSRRDRERVVERERERERERIDRERTGTGKDSASPKKKIRGDVDVDAEMEEAASAGPGSGMAAMVAAYGGAGVSDERRYHRGDNAEDVRMAP